MDKLKKLRDFFQKKLHDLDKKEVQEEIEELEDESAERRDKKTSDFITTDFTVINDSVLGGYVVRDGPFPYVNQETGERIIRYKTWDNLKEAYGKLDKVIGYGSRYQDSHYETDDRVIGHWDDFRFIPKGAKGPTPPYIDNEYNRIWSRLNTNKDILELSDLSFEELHSLPVSASYQDLGDGEIQIVGDVYHIATSLNKNEQDRCSAMGSACNASPLGDIHDQNIKGNPTHDFDSYNGVSRADISQPPTNEKNNDAKKMTKEKKEKIEDTVEKTEDDMETTKKGAAPEYEKEKDEPLLEEEDESNPKQPKKGKKDMNEFMALITDMQSKIEFLEAEDKRKSDLLERYSNDVKKQDAKDFESLGEILQKDPYNVPKDTLEEKDLTWLQEKKDFLDTLPHVKDFYKEEPLTHEKVNKYLFDFEPLENDPVANILQNTLAKTKRTLDFLKGESEK